MNRVLKKNSKFSLFNPAYWLIVGSLIALLLTSLLYYFIYSSNNVLYLDIFSPDNITIELYSSYHKQTFSEQQKIYLDLKPGRHNYRINTYKIKFDQFYFDIAEKSEKKIPPSQIKTYGALHKKTFLPDINFVNNKANRFQAQEAKEDTNTFTFFNTLLENEYRILEIQEKDILDLLDKIIICIFLIALFHLKDKRYSIILTIIFFSSIFYWFIHYSTILSINFETPQSNKIQAYWKTEKDINIFDENKSKTISYQSGLNNIKLPLNNLNNINNIRIDPGQQYTDIKIYSLQLSEQGFTTILTNSQDNFSFISFDSKEDKEEVHNKISNDYFLINSQTDDPFFFFNINPEKNKNFIYFIKITGFIILFIYLCTGLLPQKTISISQIIQIVPIIIFLYILYLANFSRYDAHPDEQAHIASVNYYTEYTDPPKVGDPRTTLTYQYPWGVSRLDNLGISYLFLGKFKAILSNFSLNSTFNARAFNCLLFGLLALYCFRNKKFAFYCLPLFCIPQVWYLFSYANRGGFALFLSIFIGWQLVNKKSQFKQYLKAKQKTINYLALPSGILTGLLVIEQTNYLSFILFSLVFIIYHFLITKTHRKQFIKKVSFIMGIAIIIVGIRYAYDVSINGFNKMEQQIALAEKISAPSFKPSIAASEQSFRGLRLYEKGTTAAELFKEKWDWHTLTFKSFVGLYGGEEGLFSAEWYYDTIKIIYFFILCVLLFDLFKHPEKTKSYLLIITLAFITLSIVMGFLFSWLYDFQPQGRYIFPLIPIIMVYFHSAEKYWSCQTKLYLRAFALVLILLSGYSFRTTALPYLVDIQFFNHYPGKTS